MERGNNSFSSKRPSIGFWISWYLFRKKHNILLGFFVTPIATQLYRFMKSCCWKNFNSWGDAWYKRIKFALVLSCKIASRLFGILDNLVWEYLEAFLDSSRYKLPITFSKYGLVGGIFRLSNGTCNQFANSRINRFKFDFLLKKDASFVNNSSFENEDDFARHSSRCLKRRIKDDTREQVLRW